MIKKSTRLRPVERLAEKKAVTATEKMVSARNDHGSHKTKLKELISYRLEYLEQYQSRAKVGMQSGQLQQYQQFISKLDVAIEQQRVVVAQANLVLEQSQTHWKDKHSHKKAINKAVERFKKQEVQAVEQTEQALLDERNTQVYNQKNNSS
ncbi:MAG: flagellar export protein FliJ [Gammaproteobacteria bacterium]|nr:MAG: flagellar export protein FliJ [Gammaproteobacteria bacterium]